MKQLSTEITELLNKKSTIDFLNAARQFVTLLENSDLNQETFYKDSHKALSELYRTALDLETIELTHSGPNSEFDEIDKDELRKIIKNLISNLGKDCFYWQVFDQTNKDDSEPVCGELLDDLGDIYKDLKFSIIIFNLDKQDCKEIALWQFKFDFDKHWGNHCINALSAIHFFLQDE